MDKLRALKYFLRTAETCSFSQTAKNFAVPASSISRRITDLEKSLGIKLFTRSTRSVALTELGRLYYSEIKDALETIERADILVSDQSQTPCGILRITSTPAFGELKLLPALQKMKKQFPEIIFDVNFTDSILDLTGHTLDIAIRSSNILPENLVARELFPHRFILVATPELLQIYGTPKTIQELETIPSIIYRGPDKLMSWQAVKDNIWNELSPTPSYISNHGPSLLDAALNGEGIALFPYWAVDEYITEGKLHEITIKDTLFSLTRETESTMFLLYHPPKYKLQKISTAINFLHREFTSLITKKNAPAIREF